MSARLKLTIAYDGSAFAGWQSQKHGNTIQDRLEAAIQRVVGKRLPVHGAGRTDAGVHAIGQCAHVDLPDRSHSPDEWQRILNALLPPHDSDHARALRQKRFPRTLFRANENISLSHLDRGCFATIRDRTSVARDEASRVSKRLSAPRGCLSAHTTSRASRRIVEKRKRQRHEQSPVRPPGNRAVFSRSNSSATVISTRWCE